MWIGSKSGEDSIFADGGHAESPESKSDKNNYSPPQNLMAFCAAMLSIR